MRGLPVGLATGLALLAGTLAPAGAGAVIPQGNLLVNGDAETGPHALNSSDVVVPQGWSAPGGIGASKPTAVGYAAPGFFTTAERAAIGGGQAFFAGGPGGGGLGVPRGRLSQFVDVSAAAAEIDAGQVQLTIGGCLGGYADQEDYSVLLALLPDLTLIADTRGPGPAERGNATTLLPRAATAAVPAGTRALVANLVSFKAEAAGTYNDGYGDNLSLVLQPVGAVPPAPVCTPTTPGGGPGGGGPGGGGPGGGGTAGETSGIAPVGKARLAGGSVRITLRCERHDGECAGRIALSVGKLPKLATSSAVRLGGKQFSIPAGQTRVLKVKLRRNARMRFRSTPRRRLRKLRLSLRVVTGAGTAQFKLRLKR